MSKTCWRNSAFALLVVVGCGAWSQAQINGTWPHSPAASLQGVWYNDGDPAQPCYVNLTSGGRSAVITDERGETVRGRIVGPGRIVVHVGQGLVGQVEGNVLYWSNGGAWSR